MTNFHLFYCNSSLSCFIAKLQTLLFALQYTQSHSSSSYAHPVGGSPLLFSRIFIQKHCWKTSTGKWVALSVWQPASRWAQRLGSLQRCPIVVPIYRQPLRSAGQDSELPHRMPTESKVVHISLNGVDAISAAAGDLGPLSRSIPRQPGVTPSRLDGSATFLTYVYRCQMINIDVCIHISDNWPRRDSLSWFRDQATNTENISFLQCDSIVPF